MALKPTIYKFNVTLADINNHRATPLLGWITPIQKSHGYTPDISAFLNFQFYESIYYKTNEDDKQ